MYLLEPVASLSVNPLVQSWKQVELLSRKLGQWPLLLFWGLKCSGICVHNTKVNLKAAGEDVQLTGLQEK